MWDTLYSNIACIQITFLHVKDKPRTLHVIWGGKEIRDEPLIIVGGVGHGFCTFFLPVSSTAFFFSIMPDPPMMINGSSLRSTEKLPLTQDTAP